MTRHLTAARLRQHGAAARRDRALRRGRHALHAGHRAGRHRQPGRRLDLGARQPAPRRRGRGPDGRRREPRLPGARRLRGHGGPPPGRAAPRPGAADRRPRLPPVEADARPSRPGAATVGGEVAHALDALAARRGDARRTRPATSPMSVLGRRQAILEAVDRLAEAGAGTALTRVHGDFHLGQVLVSQDRRLHHRLRGRAGEDVGAAPRQGEPAARRGGPAPLARLRGRGRVGHRGGCRAAAGARAPRSAARHLPARSRPTAFLRHYRAAASGTEPEDAARRARTRCSI